MRHLRVLSPMPGSGLKPGDLVVVQDDMAAAWLARGTAEDAKHLTSPPATKALRGPKETK